MAVALKNASETRKVAAPAALASSSLVGSGIVVLAVAALAYGLPSLWPARVTPVLRPALGLFVDVAGLIAAEVVGIGLAVGLAGKFFGSLAPYGTRTGSAAVVTFILLGSLATVGSGHLIQRYIAPGIESRSLGLGMTLGVAIALVVWGFALLQSPGFRKWIPAVEEQGWFTAVPYKPNQGQRVRRATMLAILAVFGAGVYTLISHRTLDAGARNWGLLLPFDGGFITTLRDVPITLPLILSLVGAWVAYRVVNLPTFADFLTATEAEINKVSWASRKSLIQDTIVVLVTVVMFTAFLLVVDVAWGFILSSDYVRVIRTGKPALKANDATSRQLDW